MSGQQRTGAFRPFSVVASGVRPTGNRVDCPVSATGELCRDPFFDTVLHGLWPRQTRDNYVFNSGLQVAGIIAADGGPWAGDTSGGFFFDPKGTTEHGTGLEGVLLSSDPQRRAAWPAAARVPGGTEGSIYRTELQGGEVASAEDAWWLNWEGDPNRLAGRTHPLGVLVENRLLQFQYPTGNEDILYLVHTFYNISSDDPSTYLGARPEIRPLLIRYARQFRRDVEARFGLVLPAGGYTINSFHAGYAADFDVGEAGSNLGSVQLPFSLGYAYAPAFPRLSFWGYPPGTFSPPFFAGTGLVGTKILSGPDPAARLQLFTMLTGSGFVPAPANVTDLYRYLSGATTGVASFPASCNTGNLAVTHVCYIQGFPSDTRQMLSAPAVTLAPGGQATFVVAYVFAAPVGGRGGCPGAGCQVLPGNVLANLDAAALAAAGTNALDSIAGFAGYVDDDGDGIASEAEFRTVPRSLFGKARLAQAIFDSRFTLPAAPAAPDFYLVPGDDRVTVLWRPSPSEATGDPYFSVAATATIPGPAGGQVPNPLFDPNYRQFDVEGYRVYRGRSDRPGELTLLAQYDYTGTTIRDYTGRVNPTPLCAPELGIRGDCVVDFDSLAAGVTPGAFQEVPLAGQVIQIRDGDRIPLTDGASLVLRADTTGGDTPTTCLCDTEVPFIFVDTTVRNSFRYFYSVTAFDVNSRQSGPASLESARSPRSVTPRGTPVNLVSEARVRVRLQGRGVDLDTAASFPTLDSVTGRFSGPFPPADAWSLTLVKFARELVQGTQEARLSLDSLALGQANLSQCCASGLPGIPARYYFTLRANGTSAALVVPLEQEFPSIFASAPYRQPVSLFRTDSALAARHAAATTDELGGTFEVRLVPGILAGDWGLGLGLNIGFAPPVSGRYARYNGARWFDGPSPARNEVAAHPTGGACGSGPTGACTATTSFNNAGSLSGVTTVYQPLSYTMLNREWRNVAESQSGARRAADYNVYWGVAGRIDSVVDVTHNVEVPFSTEAGGTWGLLNTSAQGAGGHDGRPDVLTPTDWTCVEPFRSRLSQPTNGFFPCTSPAPFLLGRQAQLGQVAFAAGASNTAANPQSPLNPSNLSPEPGFALYLAGTITHFGLAALPASGTVWSLRDYTGIIFGGNGTGGAGELGPYLFRPALRPLTAVGVEIVATLDARNGLTPDVTRRDLRRVHTVPDPYYLESGFDEGEVLRFVNLPDQAVIRIYSASGILVALLEHRSVSPSGEAAWNLRNRGGQRVASGVYFYHIESDEGRRVGRFTLVNRAQ